MKYNCVITNVNEEEVTVKIGDIEITGFVNFGTLKRIGKKAVVDIGLYDDLKICESDKNENIIVRKGNTFEYSLYGILDLGNSTLKSEIDFEIDVEELFDYGYLDGKRVKIDTVRIDFEFV